jgi:hypothetical protein
MVAAVLWKLETYTPLRAVCGRRGQLATGEKFSSQARVRISPLSQNITPPTMQKSRGASREDF